jgi:hypothetical protein
MGGMDSFGQGEGSVAGFCKLGNRPSVSIKCLATFLIRGILLLAEQLCSSVPTLLSGVRVILDILDCNKMQVRGKYFELLLFSSKRVGMAYLYCSFRTKQDISLKICKRFLSRKGLNDLRQKYFYFCVTNREF